MADPKEEPNWCTHAKSYDKNRRRLTSLHASNLIGSILPQIRSAKTILDVGSGTGAFGHAYLDFFPEGISGQKLILSDLSPGMIKQAEKSMLAKLPSNFQTKIEFCVEDGTDLKGIDTDSIDIVTSVFGAFLIPDREKVLEAVARVLVKGGTFANASWSLISVPEGFGAPFHASMMKAMKILKNEFFDQPEAPWTDWFDPDKIGDILQNRFEPPKIYRSIHSVTFENSPILWDILLNCNPFAKPEEQDPQRVEAARKAFVGMITDGDEAVPAYAVTASNLVVAHPK